MSIIAQASLAEQHAAFRRVALAVRDSKSIALYNVTAEVLGGIIRDLPPEVTRGMDIPGILKLEDEIAAFRAEWDQALEVKLADPEKYEAQLRKADPKWLDSQWKKAERVIELWSVESQEQRAGAMLQVVDALFKNAEEASAASSGGAQSFAVPAIAAYRELAHPLLAEAVDDKRPKAFKEILFSYPQDMRDRALTANMPGGLSDYNLYDWAAFKSDAETIDAMMSGASPEVRQTLPFHLSESGKIGPDHLQFSDGNPYEIFAVLENTFKHLTPKRQTDIAMHQSRYFPPIDLAILYGDKKDYSKVIALLGAAIPKERRGDFFTKSRMEDGVAEPSCLCLAAMSASLPTLEAVWALIPEESRLPALQEKSPKWGAWESAAPIEHAVRIALSARESGDSQKFAEGCKKVEFLVREFLKAGGDPAQLPSVPSNRPFSKILRKKGRPVDVSDLAKIKPEKNPMGDILVGYMSLFGEHGTIDDRGAMTAVIGPDTVRAAQERGFETHGIPKEELIQDRELGGDFKVVLRRLRSQGFTVEVQNGGRLVVCEKIRGTGYSLYRKAVFFNPGGEREVINNARLLATSTKFDASGKILEQSTSVFH